MSSVFDAINRFKANRDRDLYPQSAQQGTFDAAVDLSRAAIAALTDHNANLVPISDFYNDILRSYERYFSADQSVKTLLLRHKMEEGRIPFVFTSKFNKHQLAIRHNEPDFWIGQCGPNDRLLMIRRTPINVLCGYVAVSDDEKMAFMDWRARHPESYSLPFNVHGGVTYEDPMLFQHFDEDQQVAMIKHGIDERMYWIGFDCSHSFDWTALTEKVFGTLPHHEEAPYRDFGYVLNECITLASQIETFDPSS